MPQSEKKKRKNPGAVALARLGARKGGIARAKKLSSLKRRSIAAKAGKARMQNLSKAERSALAKEAIAARWSRVRD